MGQGESNEVIEKTITRIKVAFSQFNESSEISYKLDCSLGADIFNSSYSSIEQFLNHVDNLMYKNKKEKKRTELSKGRK